MYPIINKLGDLSCVAIAALVPAVYIFGWETLFGFVLLKILYWTFAVYVIFNIAEGLMTQPDPEGRKQDVFTSWLACLSITFTAIYVVANKVMDGTGLPDAVGPYGIALLVAMLAFSWVHAALIMGHKNAQVAEWVRTQQAAATALPPPPAHVPPAPGAAPPAPRRSSVPIIIGLLILAGMVYALAYPEKTKQFIKNLGLAELDFSIRTAARPCVWGDIKLPRPVDHITVRGWSC